MAQTKTEKAMFAAGCFWGIEEAFRNWQGFLNTTVGYSGGSMKKPTYQDVCTDQTGHAEVVEGEFDPKVVSYEQLLDLFWSIHDPTTMNRQGPDVGTQYRSAIFYHSEQQKKAALASKEKRQKKLDKKIVTEIKEASTFYPAEDYHQQYFSRHPEQAYCQTVILPKVSNLRKHWTKRLKSQSSIQ